MPKPWEQYQKKPWEQYQQPTVEPVVQPVVESKSTPMTGFAQALMGQGQAPEQERAMGAGYLEPAMTIGSSVLAEPVAGLAGLLGLPFGSQQAEQNIKDVRSALTYEPKTETGQQALQSIGETVKPVGEFISKVEKGIGDKVYEKTGSPALAAIATTLPAATMEALGFAWGRKAATLPKTAARMTRSTPRKVTQALVESAPDIKQIKDASRAIYSEIDNLGVSVKPTAYKSLINKVVSRAVKENVDDVLTPKSARVVQQLQAELSSPGAQNVTKLDQLRKKAQIAAQSADSSDARLGAIMIDEIDDFLDNMPASSFSGKGAGKIGERYKSARSLWGRARRAELINDAFDKASRQASGFENGIRTQLRSILNNKKRSRFFTKDELTAMDEVVKGTGQANVLKLVGRLGFSEGSATNVLGGLVGMGVLGPSAPVVGQVSRKFAQVATQKAARRMEALIRGGDNGQLITKHYLATVPKAQRSVQDLSEMLLSSGAELDKLIKSANKTVKEAAEIAKARKVIHASEAAGVAAATAAQPER